ncbi:MAG: phosphoribosylglycinamide formyltransferase [Candidatus Micrarchaeota archaeon]|nr:phosphoribosylglycinamide formyltransferase [Candidatus Micrarchaeota archaeon]
MLKVAVLASGRGTNLQALLDTAGRGELGAQVAVVVSDKKDAMALERARKHGVPAVFLDPKGKKREEFDREVVAEFEKRGAGLVVLAGYLKMLSPYFVETYRNRIMNIHRSLLPAFAGGLADAHARALEHGVKVTGCTVHFVDEGEDTGPIILQKAVEIAEDETPESLEGKILEQEHKLLPQAVKLFAENRLRIEGRRVRILGGAAGAAGFAGSGTR